MTHTGFSMFSKPLILYLNLPNVGWGECSGGLGVRERAGWGTWHGELSKRESTLRLLAPWDSM